MPDYTVSRQAIADASGIASVSFSGPAGRRGFRVTSVALTVSPNVPIPEVSAYKGAVNPSTLLTSKRAGDRGSLLGDSSDQLYPGELLVLQWTGCAVGALCTAVMHGEPR